MNNVVETTKAESLQFDTMLNEFIKQTSKWYVKNQECLHLVAKTIYFKAFKT